MTKIKNLFVLMLVIALGVFTACGDDSPTETEQQRKTRQLSNTWNITAVEVSGTGEYDYTSGSTITFTATNYTISGGENLPEVRNPFGSFPASGTWQWANTTNFSSVTLTPTTGATSPITLTIITLEDNSLVFSYPGAIGKAENEVTATVTATR